MNMHQPIQAEEERTMAMRLEADATEWDQLAQWGFSTEEIVTTFVALIPYFIFYRFNHWWFIADMLFYVLASISGKALNFPIYDRIAGLASRDVAALSQERRKLQTANRVRSLLCLISISLMVIQFA